MSLALFRSTLRIAVRDALADDTPPQHASGSQTRARPVLNCRPRRISRLDLVVHDRLGAPGPAS
jgi:hypothetical protein